MLEKILCNMIHVFWILVYRSIVFFHHFFKVILYLTAKFQNPPCMKCFKNYTKDLCSCPDKVNFDSIIGHKAPKPDGWLFREFVTYDLDTCYPEYIITYVREGEKWLNQKQTFFFQINFVIKTKSYRAINFIHL